MKLELIELRKISKFKEIYIAAFMCTGFLLLVLSNNAYFPGQFDFPFWKAIHDFMPYIGFWMVAIMIVVGGSRIIPIEGESGIDELLKTYKFGLNRLVIAKIVALFIYCAVVVSYFYGLSILINGYIYSIDGGNISLSQSYYSPNIPIKLGIGEWTNWQYLIYEYVYMVIASCSFGLFVFLISILVKRSVLVMAICGGVFAAFELYDKFIETFLSTNIIGHYITSLYRYGYNGMLSFFFIDKTHINELWKLMIYLFVPIIILIILNIYVYRRKARC
ncbi:hypothetical protein [Bacillus sp. JJ722]|uniref:hypothetical protein n=1 Tax=Bacillus sp. JJ722 TaxID=3122973 RepID=UPI002FFFEF61